MSTTVCRMGIFGRGRLGQAIARELERDDRFELVWQIGRSGRPDAADVAIDVSHGSAVASHLNWAVESGTNLVIGATGWTLPDLPHRLEGRIGVLVAPNFSLTVAFMKQLCAACGRFAALDEDRDPWVLEHHHRGKADAPSGTARMLAETLVETCSRKTEWVSQLDEPIAAHQLSVGVVRAGAEFGKHTVGIDSPAETLTITHTARGRAAFALGALAAASWLRGRVGLFSFDDLAADTIDPLFDSLRFDKEASK